MEKGIAGKLSVQQIAAMEGVSDDTVRRWIATGALQCWEYPGSGKEVIVRVDPADLEAFRSRYRRKPVIVDSKVRDFSGHTGRRRAGH